MTKKHWVVVLFPSDEMVVVDVFADNCRVTHNGALEFSIIEPNGWGDMEYALLRAFAPTTWREASLVREARTDGLREQCGAKMGVKRAEEK